MSQETQDPGGNESQSDVKDPRTGESNTEASESSDGRSGERPLDGVRVVDVGNFAAGPYAV